MKAKFVLFLVVFILSFTGLLKSQCYTVLSVKGEIVLEKTGQPIKEMDEICANDKLVFSSAESKAAVLSSEQGRFIIKMSGKKRGNDLTTFVKSVLFQGTGNLSSRGTVSLETEFEDEYFVTGVNKLQVDSKTYPMDSDKFFFIRYKYKDNEVNKKLKFSNDTLFFENENIYSVDGENIKQSLIESVNLYYYEKDKNTSTKISTFKLVFANEKKLQDDLNSYVFLLKKSGKDKSYIEEEVLLYIMDVYGKINIDNTKVWMSKNLEIY
ncbi:MAG: hypothetical protein NTU73_12130 [Ignavibacteriae bacterium]|nr:hypothetical protein [Ignavibacteriota bacterium]